MVIKITSLKTSADISQQKILRFLNQSVISHDAIIHNPKINVN